MIRKLSESDRRRVMEFLLPEKEFNIFIIGDIENHGFSEDFQELWGEFDDNGDFIAVLLRYMRNSIVYAPGEYRAGEFARMILNHPEITTVMGKTTVIDKLNAAGRLEYSKARTTYLARMQKMDVSPAEPSGQIDVQAASLDDIPLIVELHNSIDEFDYDSAEEKTAALIRDLECKSGRAYFVADRGRVISTALTTAENSFSALVRGVATDTSHRNRGLATACMVALCKDLLNEGKTPCLFYDNPAAGAIYRRLGFQDLGTWQFSMLR